jgi:hypothetical protein
MTKTPGADYTATADGTSTVPKSPDFSSKGQPDYTVTADGTYSFYKFRSMLLPGPIDSSITQDPETWQLDYTYSIPNAAALAIGTPGVDGTLTGNIDD